MGSVVRHRRGARAAARLGGVSEREVTAARSATSDHGIAAEAQHLVVVTDDEGRLMSIVGNQRVRLGAAEEMGFVEGALRSEEVAGTNAVGTAVALDHAAPSSAAGRVRIDARDEAQQAC
jgi:hypothetical protein